MKDFFEKEEYTEDDINRIVSEKWEESLNLEFKSSEELSNTDPKKKEISKDVSAFANSAGGIIIYGIQEENHVAEAVSFVDGNTITKEWLEQAGFKDPQHIRFSVFNVCSCIVGIRPIDA